jgi:hypothetical protein
MSATTYQPLLTSDQVQDLRRATELAAALGVQQGLQREVHRHVRWFVYAVVVTALAAGSLVHIVDAAWLLAPAPPPLIFRCGGR